MTTERNLEIGNSLLNQREKNLPTFELGTNMTTEREQEYGIAKSLMYQRQKNLHGRDEIDSNEKGPERQNEILTNTDYYKAQIYGTWSNLDGRDKSRSTRSRRSKSESRKGKILNCKDTSYERL